MAEKLVQLAIKVRDDGSIEVLDRVDQKLDELGDGVRRSSAEMGGGLAALRGSLLQVWAAVELGEKALRAVGAVAGSFLDAASTAEQYRVRLEVLLRSQGEANRLFDEMNRYAAQTPFEFQEIMGAATALSGVVQGGVGEVTRLMPLIGDLAAASGLSIQETTGQVIRMWSAGAASADLFRERGILAMLGFQAGVTYSAEETRKQVIAAWEKTDSQFRGATEKLAGTWAGLTSMLSDKWFGFRTRLMEAGVFETLKAQTADWNAALGKMLEPGGTLDLLAQRLGRVVGELRTLPLEIERKDLLFNIGKAEGSVWGKRAKDFFVSDEDLAAMKDRLAEVNRALGAVAAKGVPADSWLARDRGRPRPEAPAGRPDRAWTKEDQAKLDAARWTAVPAADGFRARDQGMEDAAGRAQKILADQVAAEESAREAVARSLAGLEAERLRQAIGRGLAEDKDRRDRVAADVAAAREITDVWLRAAQERQDAETRAAQAIVDAEEKAADERIETERRVAQEREALWASGLSLTGQLAGETAGLMRQMYEDSGGAQEKYWKAYKAFAVAETVVNTAAAIMRAYKDFGPVAGTAFGAVIGALGAAKVALISQQEPAKAFAEGGIFMQPFSGRITAAEPGVGPEVIAPLSRLPELLAQAGGGAAGGGAGGRAPVTVYVNQQVTGIGDADLLRQVRVAGYAAGVAGVREGWHDPRGRRAMRRAART